MTNYLGFKMISYFANNEQPKDIIMNFKNELVTKYTKEIMLGINVHNVLARYNYLRKNRESIPYETPIELLKDEWITQGFANEFEEKESFDKASLMLKEYFGNRQDREKEIIFIEKKLTKIIDKDIVLFGKPDKVFRNIDDKLEIIDYKTTSNIKYYLNPLDNIQLCLYLILVKEALGYYPDIMSTYYLAQNKKVTCYLTNKQISLIEDNFSRIINNIKRFYSKNNISPLTKDKSTGNSATNSKCVI